MPTTPPAGSETKTLTVELKAGEAEGDFAATFATLNVIDHHGDVTVPGAFKNGAEVLVGAYQHDMDRLPVGKATIHSDSDRAWVEGRFFTETSGGLDTYRTIKAAGSTLEWSYIFQPTIAEPGQFDGAEVRFLKGIDVWSVDPVLRGAGMGTRTEHVKSLGLSFTEHIAGGIAGVADLIERVEARAAMRATEGRTLGADSRASIVELVTQLTELRFRLDDVLAPDAEQAEIELSRLHLQFADVLRRAS